MSIHRLKFSDLDREALAKKKIPYAPDYPNIDLLRTMVQKPWGEEYLMYKNDFVEIWHLCILPGQSTSVHCHPNKKTGLIVLDGKVETSSLSQAYHLSGLDGVIIDPSVFHATRSIGDCEAHVLEIETPPRKFDLVRLKDQYGRQDQGYEGRDKMREQQGVLHFSIDKTTLRQQQTFQNGCVLDIMRVHEDQIRELADFDVCIVLEGLLFGPNNQRIYGIADVVHGDEIRSYIDSIRMFNLLVLGLTQRT